MLLGDTCTRGCQFCAVKTSQAPPAPDPFEPLKAAGEIVKWGVDYVVLTSVDRDDLADGGASHFRLTVENLKQASQGKMLVECLVSDFAGNLTSVSHLAKAGMDVYAHNVETVPRLQKFVRDKRAGYEQVRGREEGFAGKKKEKKRRTGLASWSSLEGSVVHKPPFVCYCPFKLIFLLLFFIFFFFVSLFSSFFFLLFSLLFLFLFLSSPFFFFLSLSLFFSFSLCFSTLSLLAQSLSTLAHAKEVGGVYTKTSLMLGLGETDSEVLQTMRDLRGIDVDVVTFGQYLRPTEHHLSVVEYVTEEKFDYFRVKGEEMGFRYVASGPMVRSSYKAGEYFINNMIRGDRGEVQEKE